MKRAQMPGDSELRQLLGTQGLLDDGLTARRQLGGVGPGVVAGLELLLITPDAGAELLPEALPVVAPAQLVGDRAARLLILVDDDWTTAPDWPSSRTTSPAKTNVSPRSATTMGSSRKT